DEKTELADIEEKIWDPTLEIPVKLRNLEPIWRKLNKAELDYTAIQRENRSLELENKNLKSYLRNYIDLASIQGDELSKQGLEMTRQEKETRRGKIH
ncbi:coiled-coil domain-containing protein 65 homolog, partial [Eurytemora carolleeae]|uniref:coiled-coil domain-containing protein 65 homolog n=1 Tax=Eurytemora carolleeae TaxID=1294199 RepID=UPI000C758C58